MAAPAAIIHRDMAQASSNRFQARHDRVEILDVVREVSASARPQDPEHVTQRDFDHARAAAGHPACPRARSIAGRLGCPWATVLAAAHRDPADAHRYLSQAASDKSSKGFTEEGLLVALKQAAVRLGTGDLSRSDYARAYAEITGSSRRAWRHGAPPRMPSLSQADSFLRRLGISWEEACRRAGLSARRAPRGGAVSFDQAVELFAQATGHVPRSREQLQAFAAARRFSLRRSGNGALVQAVRRAQATRPQPLPRAPRQMALPSADAPPPGARQPRRGHTGWNRENIIAGMASATALLPPGEPLTSRALKQIAAAHPELGIPSTSVVTRYIKRADASSSWADYVREARTLATSRAG